MNGTTKRVLIKNIILDLNNPRHIDLKKLKKKL